MALRTKWDVMSERVADARRALELMERDMESLKTLKCEVNCSGCGQFLATEADFAKHFVIPDEQHWNLGECPVQVARDKAKAYGARRD